MADDSADDSTGDDSRELGVEFGDLAEALAAVDYPVTNEELLAEYGDRTVDLQGGEESLSEVLGEYPDDRTFEDADGVEQAVLNMVGGEAVGRRRYSDRGTGDVDPDTDESV